MPDAARSDGDRQFPCAGLGFTSSKPLEHQKNAVGADWKGRTPPVLYLIAIGAAFYAPWIAQAIYVVVALMWLVPDRRIERALARKHHHAESSS